MMAEFNSEFNPDSSFWLPITCHVKSTLCENSKTCQVKLHREPN